MEVDNDNNKEFSENVNLRDSIDHLTSSENNRNYTKSFHETFEKSQLELLIESDNNSSSLENILLQDDLLLEIKCLNKDVLN